MDVSADTSLRALEMPPALTAGRYLVFGRTTIERRYPVNMLKLMGANLIAETATPADADFECLVRRPDLLLWNLSSDGLEEIARFLQLVAARCAKPPAIIAICGACSEPFMREALRLGLCGVLLRPFSPSRLAAQIIRAEREQASRFEID
jgi:AmiR/NasT family two-component response regulator